MNTFSNYPAANAAFNALGANKFVAMTGAKNFVAREEGLSFVLPRVSNGIKGVEICLNEDDEFEVCFYNSNFAPVHTIGAVIAENLRKVFERYTRVLTSL